MSKGRFFGKLKIWQQRLATYVSMVQFAMVFYIFIIESPMGLQWYHWFLLTFCGITVLMVFDIKIVMPHSLDYTFEKTSKLMELKKDVELIKKKLFDKEDR